MTSEEWAATRTVLVRWECPHPDHSARRCADAWPVYEHRRTT